MSLRLPATLPLRTVLFRARVFAAALALAAACSQASTVPAQDPDRACATCHRKIYASYRHTPMANASGSAVDGLLPGTFLHPQSGIRYRLFLRDGEAFLAYDRPSTDPTLSLHGEQKLRYYVGSGNRGRTYLFERDGYWFESPVNWYSKKKVWDMAPNYGNATHMPFTLPVDAGCLHCHASDVQASLPGSRNHFAGPPFLHSGITCESCHGDPRAHLAQAGNGPILNPSKLPAARRDFVCLQCHLEGESAVNRRGRSLATFQPGDDLYADVVYFVRKGEIGANGRATSQWEALLQSECKRKSGDRLTCTTCHDPHYSPPPAERVRYYREKCLACHSGVKFAQRHHPEQPDCASCHMPRQKSEDIAHEQVTDHRIQRPSTIVLHSAGADALDLIPVGGEPIDARDLGLAYAQLGERGNRAAGERAMPLLRQAEQQEGPRIQDPDLHTELGFLDQMSGNISGAESEYRMAIAMSPVDGAAAGDLAVLLAHAGAMTEAIPLWRTAFDQDPGVSAAGFDLAVGYCAVGDRNQAVATLRRVVAFSPDDPKARRLMQAILDGQQKCGGN